MSSLGGPTLKKNNAETSDSMVSYLDTSDLPRIKQKCNSFILLRLCRLFQIKV